MAAAAFPLDRYRDAELTLEDLVAAAARLLRRLDVRPGDGRIAQAPDARGIRYYQTVGVLDRPLRYDGRRAIYGFRHLLQLLAVKRLQQEGHPLHLIQQSLAGRPTAALEQALGAMLAGLGQGPQRQQTQGHAPQAEAPEAEVAPAPLIAARLAPGVTITIDPAVVADPGALIARLAAALAPLAPEIPTIEDPARQHNASERVAPGGAAPPAPQARQPLQAPFGPSTGGAARRQDPHQDRQPERPPQPTKEH